MKTIERLESNVRSYCRSFPVKFDRARGAVLTDSSGRRYLDFLAGAGTLNYGHNPPALKEAVIAYLSDDRIIHGLDMATVAKERFLAAFERLILKPRGLDYKMQFTGPTGTNAVEAALKIARNHTGRHTVVAFTNAFHGVTSGSLACTANSYYRQAGGMPPQGVVFAPYDGYLGPDVDTIDVLEKMILDGSSGLDLPAAVIVETVQGEGGVNVAGLDWLRKLAALCRRHEILLIVDDIQMGCGRTGGFFSFEPAKIKPDIVTLSKSLSGYGLPMSLVLLKPSLDNWQPGEHNGTFRGNNLAFVTARTAVEQFWADDGLSREVLRKSKIMARRLGQLATDDGRIEPRGRGMIQGLDCKSGQRASDIRQRSFEEGLVIETSGSEGQVVKCLCPLTISDAQLQAGLDILARSVAATADGDYDKIAC